jgi:acyl carrier protein
MEKKEFIEKFAEAIERESEIKMEDEFRNYDEWSSIAYLSVIAFMDDEYDTQIEEAEFKKLRTVEDLYKACVKE